MRRTLLTALTSCTVVVATALVPAGIAAAATPSAVADVPTLRLSGQDRYETAVRISEQVFPDPDDAFPAAPVVYIASGAGFPDALSAAPAAAHLGGPVLLTAPSMLPQVVADELQRIDPYRVVIAGGVNAVSPAVEAALTRLLPDTDVDRIGGADRYATSRAIAADAFLDPTWQGYAGDRPTDALDWGSEAGPASFDDDRVYVATGASFPDALSAGAAAGAHDAPLILVPGLASGLDAPTEQAIAAYAPRSIIAAGGPAVVSDGVVQGLGGLIAKGTPANAVRVSGDDRYETARWIMNTGFTTGDGRAYGAAANREEAAVFVATGTNFPDALAGAAAAGYLRLPLVLTPGSCLSSSLQHDGMYQQPEGLVLLGGPVAIADSVTSATC